MMPYFLFSTFFLWTPYLGEIFEAIEFNLILQNGFSSSETRMNKLSEIGANHWEQYYGQDFNRSEKDFSNLKYPASYPVNASHHIHRREKNSSRLSLFLCSEWTSFALDGMKSVGKNINSELNRFSFDENPVFNIKFISVGFKTGMFLAVVSINARSTKKKTWE